MNKHFFDILDQLKKNEKQKGLLAVAKKKGRQPVHNAFRLIEGPTYPCNHNFLLITD